MSTLVALGIILLFSGLAVSQVSYPDCTDATLDWSFNSVGQNPCEVVAYLQSTCWGGSFTVPPLQPGYEYSGTDSNAPPDLCYCNTVTYSLISACDACQGAQWFSWSDWVINCTQTLPPGTFPNPVPAGIYVPYWSTLDVTLENTWDIGNAMAAGDSPEIGPGQSIGGSGSSPTQTPAGTPAQSSPATPAQSPPTTPSQSPPATPAQSPPATPTQSSPATPAQSPPPTPTQSSPATPAQSPPATPTQSQPATGFPATTTPTSKPNGPMPTLPTPSSSFTSAPASLSRGKSSKTAPIVGGAVAGVAVVGIVILVLFYMRRREHSKSPYGAPSVDVPSPAPGPFAYQHQTEHQALTSPRTAMSEEGTFASSSSPAPPDSSVHSAPMRVYDPRDPTTFPDMSTLQQYAPNVAPQVIFGASRSTVATQPSMPQYYGLPTGPARPMPPLDSSYAPRTSSN